MQKLIIGRKKNMDSQYLIGQWQWQWQSGLRFGSKSSISVPSLRFGPNLSSVPQFVEIFALFRSLYLSLSLSLSELGEAHIVVSLSLIQTLTLHNPALSEDRFQVYAQAHQISVSSLPPSFSFKTLIFPFSGGLFLLGNSE